MPPRRLVLLALLLVTTVQADAAFIASGLQSLVDDADVIVVGTASTVTSRRTGSSAETVTTLSVDTVVKGVPSPIVTILTDGGTTATVTVFVEHEASFATGERHVLFLDGPDGGGNFHVASGEHGALRVVNDLIPSTGQSLTELLAEIDTLCGPSCP